MEQRFAAAPVLGEDAALIPDLERALASTPTREILWEQLITALYRAGRQSDALGAFSRARRTLAEELGIDPGPRLQSLQGAVLAQDAELEHVARAGLVDRAEAVQAFEGRAEELAWLSSQQASTIFTAEPGSPSAERLRLLASWSAKPTSVPQLRPSEVRTSAGDRRGGREG
jgi:DNA-binding SARP family transcriptional activator